MNTSLPLNWQRVWTRELQCRIIWNATARTAPYRLQSSSSHFSLPVPLHPLCVSHERNSLTFHVTSCELQTASEWENKHYFQYYIARFNFLDEMRLEPVCKETGPAIRTLFRSVCPTRRQCTHDRTRFFSRWKLKVSPNRRSYAHCAWIRDWVSEMILHVTCAAYGSSTTECRRTLPSPETFFVFRRLPRQLYLPFRYRKQSQRVLD